MSATMCPRLPPPLGRRGYIDLEDVFIKQHIGRGATLKKLSSRLKVDSAKILEDLVLYPSFLLEENKNI